MLVGVRGRCIPSYAGGYLAQEMNGVDTAMVKRVSEGESGRFLFCWIFSQKYIGNTYFYLFSFR